MSEISLYKNCQDKETLKLFKEITNFLTPYYHYPAMQCESEWKTSLILLDNPEIDTQEVLGEGILLQGEKILTLIALMLEKLV